MRLAPFHSARQDLLPVVALTSKQNLHTLMKFMSSRCVPMQDVRQEQAPSCPYVAATTRANGSCLVEE